MTKFVAGIDFGTTNSTAAISDGGTPRMVDLEGGHDIIPTALYFPEKSPAVYFGRDAQRKYTDGDTDGRFMRSIKRILGSDTMRSNTIINDHPVKFDVIIGHFIKHIKQKIDAAAGGSVDAVVMGRPVHFRDNDAPGDARAQNELEQIARAAGFKDVAFQFEPIAAAFTHEQHLTSEKLAFVADIGGGTSDFTVIRLSPLRATNFNRADDVLANTGVRIGGNDFDKDLALASFMPCFGMGTEYKANDKNIILPTSPYISLATWCRVNEVYNYKTLNMVHGFTVWGLAPEKVKRLHEIIERRLGHTNLSYVENAKIDLSDKTAVTVPLDFLTDCPIIQTTRDAFNASIRDDVDRIEKSVRECIEMAGVKNTDIELVVLTGGSTEIPYIYNIVRSNFPNAEISASNKMASVGLGLAYDSMRRYLLK